MSLPTRRIEREMLPRDLVLFLDGPVIARSLPGHSKSAWADKLADGEARGLIRSPGKSPEWQLTTMGMHVAIEWLRKGPSA